LEKNLALVTLFREFVEVTSNCVITIPFTVDNVQDVCIRPARGLNDESTAKIETEAGQLVPVEAFRYDDFFFPGTTLTPGNYKLIITAGEVKNPYYSKVKIEGQSDLQMETVIVPPTANSDRRGLVQIRLFHSDYGTPIENATVNIYGRILEHKGNGIYTTTFPQSFATGEYARDGELVSIYARGSYQGVAFQRHHEQIVKAFNGDLLFVPPFSWNVIRDTHDPTVVTSVILKAGVEVRKKAKYEVSGSITVADNKEVALQYRDWFAPEPENPAKKACGGWYGILEVGNHNVEVEFDIGLEELLASGDKIYRLFYVDAWSNDEDDKCDAIINLGDFSLLVLN
jgi:hypothetical protein